MKKVMCFGTFDKLHPGHLSYLKQAKKYGNFLVVVVARDLNVIKIKNNKPTENENERLKKIKKIEFVDKAVLGGRSNKYDIIKNIKPDILCLGYDQTVDEDKLKEEFRGDIFRMKAYKEDLYKSSLMK